MSHELDRTADGRGAMFSFGETPWHQNDTNSRVLTVAPRTVVEAADLSGLNWPVALVPTFMKDLDETYLEIDNAFAVVRTDRNAALAVVGSFYRPLQNLDMLATLQPLVDQGLANWETAGSLFGGRKVWAQVRLNLDSKIIRAAYGANDDKIIPFEIIMNSHDGSGKVVLAETRIRVVCRNTEIMAEHDVRARASTQRVTHNQLVEVNVAKAAEALWKDLVNRHEALANQLIQLRRTRLDEKMFRELVLDVAVPLPVQGKDNALAAALMKTRLEKAEEKRKIVRKLWTDGLGQSGEKTAEAALNALTEATDHEDRGVFSAKGLQSFMPGGSLQTVKAKVYHGLLSYSNKVNAKVARKV